MLPDCDPPELGNEDEERARLMDSAAALASAPDRKACGCGPGDMCTRCTDPETFAQAFMAALSMLIREGEARDA